MKFALTAIAAAAFLLPAGMAKAECSPENWKDCKGKSWVIGDTMETPLGSKWWPHPLWGAEDTAGSTNWYTKPEVVKRGLAEADQGDVYRLGRDYTTKMPLFGTRTFTMMIPERGNASGANKLFGRQEYVATNIGQVGTQFDGLGHIGIELGSPGNPAESRFYNGFTEAEVVTGDGLKKLGVENLHPIVARGILIDVAAAKGVESLERGYEITMDDVREALTNQEMANFKFEPGDGVFFRTGWGTHWDDPATYNNGAPGIGMEVARWLSDEVQAGVMGADTWPTEVVPNPDKGCVFCVHSHMITRHGIVNQENMNLDGPSEDGVYTFLYMYSPTPVAGATGSMASPVAID